MGTPFRALDRGARPFQGFRQSFLFVVFMTHPTISAARPASSVPAFLAVHSGITGAVVGVERTSSAASPYSTLGAKPGYTTTLETPETCLDAELRSTLPVMTE